MKQFKDLSELRQKRIIKLLNKKYARLGFITSNERIDINGESAIYNINNILDELRRY